MTSSAVISALQYADDAAFPFLTADELQRSLDVVCETYNRVNTTKTEVLTTSPPDDPPVSISGQQPKKIIYISILTVTSKQHSVLTLRAQLRFSNNIYRQHATEYGNRSVRKLSSSSLVLSSCYIGLKCRHYALNFFSLYK